MAALKIIGTTISLSGIVILLLGISTYVWPTLEGRVVEIKKYHAVYDNTPAIAGGKKPKLRDTQVNTITIRYEYRIDGQHYTNDTTSLFSKRIQYFDETLLPKVGDIIRITYLPIAKSYSLINAGPPIIVIIVLIISGAFLLYIKKISLWFLTIIIIQK